MPASPTAPAVMPGSRFTRILFAVAFALGAVTFGVRLVRGLRGGDVQWLEMTLPAAVLVMLTAILTGPRRPWLYYPLLVVSFALLVGFYVTPHRAPPASGPNRAPQPTAVPVGR